MTKTETKSRTGEDLSPAQALTAAMTGFMSDFKAFSQDVKAQLQEQDVRMTKLDRKTMMTARPALAQAATEEAPHQKAFAAYLRSGDDDALRGLHARHAGVFLAVGLAGGGAQAEHLHPAGQAAFQAALVQRQAGEHDLGGLVLEQALEQFIGIRHLRDLGRMHE